jgi:hypothetical protein
MKINKANEIALSNGSVIFMLKNKEARQNESTGDIIPDNNTSSACSNANGAMQGNGNNTD